MILSNSLRCWRSTFWGTPRPSKRRPLQSLWSGWCCRRLAAGGYQEYKATADPLQKQPGHLVEGEIHHWYTNYTIYDGEYGQQHDIWWNLVARCVVFTVPSTLWRKMSLARNMIYLNGEFIISMSICCREYFPTYMSFWLVKSTTVGVGRCWEWGSLGSIFGGSLYWLLHGFA